MMNLEEMTEAEALRVAKKISGKTKKEIADHLGISRGIITRYLKENDKYSPRMGMIPALCRALGNDILLQWLETRIREKGERRKEKMRLHMAKMEKALKEMMLLLGTEEETAPEDVEEARDLIHTIKRECQRLDFLLSRARYHSAAPEGNAIVAGRRMGQKRLERKG